MSAIQIRDWRPLRKGALLGFAKVELPSGMILADVAILAGDHGPWASPPSKPMLDRGGVALKDGAGKFKYAPIVEFVSAAVRDRFSGGVIDALRAAHPEALP